ncbi:hypothetical protein CPC08DRAFT_715885 [Agrocybe pediades]|nr:hypothetical protein CPC08DRAFT_715885 [Agrocybe pediades]
MTICISSLLPLKVPVHCIPSNRNVIIRQFATLHVHTRVPRRPRNVLTLDPKRMLDMGQPCMDITNVSGFWLRFPTLDAKQLRKTSLGVPLPFHISHDHTSCNLSYKYSKTLKTKLRFPPAVGVLYYHKSNPELASSLRFRICDDVSELSFKRGQDLMLPTIGGEEPTPWHISLLNLAWSKTYGPFQQLLLDDGLVDTSLIEDIKRLEVNANSHTLYSLDEPFVVDVSVQRYVCRFVTRKSVTDTLSLELFAVITHQGRKVPFSGKVRARFVLSDLPEHRKDPAILLQFLDILTPIRRNERQGISPVQEPKAGEYLRRYGKVWSLSLKRTSYGRQIAEIFQIPLGV